MAEKETWLLSGASGLLGEALARTLAAAGRPVLRLVRHAPRSAEEIEWNPAAEAETGRALDGPRVAVHLSGATIARRWTAAYKHTLRESRLASTRALSIRLARARSRPEVLLVASAVGFYGDRGEELLEETSAPGQGFLAELCQDWEHAADPAREAGIRVLHLRFGLILALQGGALARLLPLFRLGLGGALGSGRQWMSWIALDDALRAILFAAARPDLAGPVNLVAPEPVRNAVFTRALARALHRPAPFPAPTPLLRLALGQMAQETLLASQRCRPALLERAGFQFAAPQLDSALAALLAPHTGALS